MRFFSRGIKPAKSHNQNFPVSLSLLSKLGSLNFQLFKILLPLEGKPNTDPHLKAHISKDHPKFCCITCGKRFRKADILEKHTLSHEEEVIKKEESDEKMLHRKQERKETYSCLNCDYVATRKHHLKGHQWNNHMREKDVKAKLPKTIARCTKGCGYTSKWGNRNGNIQRHETICQFGGVFVLI